ncbi:MAG: ABC transporter substrate-binding protein, partial [Promethearchaeota archaeon]
MHEKSVVLLVVLFGFMMILSSPVSRVSAIGDTQEMWSGIAAFEEYYDDDYNDWVCGISVQTQADMDMLESMVFEFEALARGAGYHHVQHLRIPANTFQSGGEVVVSTFDTSGILIDVSTPVFFTPSEEQDIIVFPDSWVALPPHDPPYIDDRMANVFDGSGIQPGQVVQVSFVFDEAFYMDLSQYFQVLGVHGEGLFFDPWMEVPSAGITIHMGDDWALITDDDWVWPDEHSPIWEAYPVVQEGPPIYFPSDWYDSQPTDQIWQPYQESNIEYDNSLWTWNYNGLSSEWSPDALDTQSRWLFRSETSFGLDVASSSPLDLEEYHDPFDYSDGVSHYTWNSEQLVEFVLDSHMQSEPGIEVSRSSNATILSPGYNSVEITAEVTFNSNPIIDGTEHSIQSFWIGFDTRARSDTIEILYTSDHSYWTPVALGQTVSFSAEAYAINPFEYPVRWMPTVDLNLFIEDRLYSEQYSTGVGSVEFQTTGSAGDVLDVTLSGQPDQAIDAAPSPLHGDLWLWWIGDYQQIELSSLQSITWESLGTPSTLDPHRCYDRFGNWISDNVYETLFTYPFDSADNSELIPLLAESVDISDDGKNYTFQLREGVRFHDGTLFTAEAVKYNLERLMKIFDTGGPAWMIAEPILGGLEVENAAFGFGPGSPEHILAYENWIAQDPIIVLDTYTVRIRLDTRYVPFLQCLTYKIGSMISPTWIENHGGVDYGANNEYVDTHTCGTGPYEVVDYIMGESIQLARNYDYWRETEAILTNPNVGSLDIVTINMIDDVWTRRDNLLSGASDGTWLSHEIDYDLWNPDTSASLSPEIKVYSGDVSYAVFGLGFNLHTQYDIDGVSYQNPFALKDFRVVVSYAFDYLADIAAEEEWFGGLAVQAQGCIPIGMFGHDDNLFMYEYNLDLAVDAWNEAMLNGLDGILADNSYQLTFYNRLEGGAMNEGPVFAKLGIESILSHPGAIQPSQPLTVNVVSVPRTEYNIMRNSNQLLLPFVGWAPDYADPDNYASPFFYEYGFWAGLIGYSDPDVNSWYEQSRVETDPEARAQLFYQMQQRVADDVVYLMTVQLEDLSFQRLNVFGYAYNPMRLSPSVYGSGPYFYHMWKEPIVPPYYDPQSTIMWETSHNPSTLDPHVCYEVIGNWVSYNVYETLFTYPRDSPSTDTLIPLLAESVDISENGLEYTFHLRHGVTFQDGTPFNAEAVKYNIERAIAIFDPWGPAWMLAEPLLDCKAIEDAVFDEGPGGGQGGPNHEALFNAWKAENDAGTGALWVIDDYTIMMRLADSYAPFLHALTYEVGAIISPTWVENHGGVVVGQSNPYVDRHACGTGPYRLVEWAPDNLILLVQNHNYWGMDEAQTINPNSGSIETVVIRINPDDSSREDHLLQGETDGCLWPLADAYEIWDPETQTSTNPQIQTWSNELSYILRGAGFNLRQYIEIDDLTIENPFFLKDLRIALSYSFDYDSYIENTLSSLAVQGQGPIPIGMFGHDDNLFMFTYDIDLAVQAWNTAMASGLEQILANNDYNLRFYTVNSWWMTPMLDYVEQGFRAILANEDAIQPSQPLNIEIVFLDGDTYNSLRNTGNLPIIAVGWAPDYADPDNYAIAFAASFVAWGRFTGYGTEMTDAWVRQAAESMDDAERLSLYQQIQQAVVDEVAYIWADQEKDFHVERWNVHGYSFNPMKSGPYFYNYWKEPLVVGPPEYLEFTYCSSESQVAPKVFDGVVDLGSGFLTDTNAVDLSSYNLQEELRSGFGNIVFNTNWYPLDITAFRRAFAFALDKWSFGPNIYGDGLPLDVALPRTFTQYCIEGTLPFSYYDSNTELANQMLDQAGFIDINGDGIREAPDGSQLSIPLMLIDHPSHYAVLEIVTEAMESLGISCYPNIVDYPAFVETFRSHGDFAMTFYGQLLDNDPTWLAREFHSMNADTYGMNTPNFENSTFDYYADIMLSATSQQEAYDACAMLQYILAYECPIIPVYENYLPAAVRNGFE